jgi:hypothetical protein
MMAMIVTSAAIAAATRDADARPEISAVPPGPHRFVSDAAGGCQNRSGERTLLHQHAWLSAPRSTRAIETRRGDRSTALRAGRLAAAGRNRADRRLVRKFRSSACESRRCGERTGFARATGRGESARRFEAGRHRRLAAGAIVGPRTLIIQAEQPDRFRGRDETQSAIRNPQSEIVTCVPAADVARPHRRTRTAVDRSGASAPGACAPRGHAR